ncbi:hypothetical protein BRADI_3g11492v3 [Brachypodium distachyon]|uniref:Uncharacterized protein n=1 Tax=Brachypodium distachyon TaxID=15368 RepID=A0A2K2CWN3_BRADI|nr:hypothetical protein BRADI_3g11492v3 [Brachypodium distachyon]
MPPNTGCLSTSSTRAGPSRSPRRMRRPRSQFVVVPSSPCWLLYILQGRPSYDIQLEDNFHVALNDNISWQTNYSLYYEFYLPYTPSSDS